MDAPRMMVEALFSTRLCKSYAIKEDEFGEAICTLRFKKRRGIPSPNGQMYVPAQYTAYRKLPQSQNYRNRNRMEKFNKSKSLSCDKMPGNYNAKSADAGVPPGQSLNPEAHPFTPVTTGTEPAKSVGNPGGSPRDKSQSDMSVSQPLFSDSDSGSLNVSTIEAILLDRLSEVPSTSDCPVSEPLVSVKEDSSVVGGPTQVSDDILKETVCVLSRSDSISDITSLVVQEPDPPDSPSQLLGEKKPSCSIPTASDGNNEGPLDRFSVDTISDEMSEQFRLKYIEMFDTASTTVSLKPDPLPD